MDLHKGDTCVYCDTPHDDVAPGPCPASREVLAAKRDALLAVIKGVHNVLNHPVKAGRVWVSYRREQIEHSLKQLFDAVQSSEKAP